LLQGLLQGLLCKLCWRLLHQLWLLTLHLLQNLNWQLHLLLLRHEPLHGALQELPLHLHGLLLWLLLLLLAIAADRCEGGLGHGPALLHRALQSLLLLLRANLACHQCWLLLLLLLLLRGHLPHPGSLYDHVVGLLLLLTLTSIELAQSCTLLAHLQEGRGRQLI